MSAISARSAANPPAPSTVPDPVKLAEKKAGELPQRIKRHDGGCYLYGANGPVQKLDCPPVMDKSGEEIEREPESGQCIHIEPWKGEPKEAECPAVLVPVGYVSAKKVAPKGLASAPPPAGLAPQKSESGCARSCATTGTGPSTSGVVALAFAGVVGAARRARRRTR